jgi:putative toxin-antitoxin system, toxin component
MLPEHFSTIEALHHDAHQMAAEVRHTYRCHTFPVDPIKLLLALGCPVYTAKLGDNRVGVVLQDSEMFMTTYLEENQSSSWLRVSAARALRFYVDRSRRSHILPRDIDWYPYPPADVGTSEGKRREWVEVFAHELLMPQDEIHKYKNLPRVRLARRFGVPVPVVNYWVQKT